ncbi:hypothetical protein [Streptococcus merionis]|uniref:Lin0368 family putative glycerol transporter subunit n=1 Tax=Streptococcus merionis TaxID=400065 RepID=UPI0026EFCDE0|nr:hypothetical protein [Streptococcus merionis]
MKWIKSLTAYAFAGFFVPFLWQTVAQPLDHLAGYAAALLIIGPVWYLVHYRQWISTYEKGVTTDMGLAVAIAVFTRALLSIGLGSLDLSLQTAVWVIVGAIIAGLAAFLVERWLWRKKHHDF